MTTDAGRKDDAQRAPRLRARSVLPVGVVLVLLVGLMTAGVAVAQHETRARLSSSFTLRASASAAVASRYVADLAASEVRVGDATFASGPVEAAALATARGALGLEDAFVVGPGGSVVGGSVVAGSGAAGEVLARRLGAELLAASATSSVEISGVVQGPGAFVEIAARFGAPGAERVLVGLLDLARTPLPTVLAHALVQQGGLAYLVDASDVVVASSSGFTGIPLASANTLLDHALDRFSGPVPGSGGVPGAPAGDELAVAAVPGTPWRVVLEIPTAALFAADSGWTEVVPWVLLALGSLLAVGLAGLFLRLVQDRHELATFSVRMARAASTDPLTGLANRRRLAAAVAEHDASELDDPTSVLMIDLDKFKPINDTYGHETGDELLRLVAASMHRVFRQTDVWGRWGGDEFLALLPGANGPEAESVAVRLVEALGEVELEVDGDRVPVELSVGCATGRGDAVELVARADEALYLAKRAGGGQIVRVDDELSVIRQV